MRDIDIFKAKFINACNVINDANDRDIKREPTRCIAQYLLGDIFKIWEIGTSKALDSAIFEAITQEHVFKLIEKGILENFEKSILEKDILEHSKKSSDRINIYKYKGIATVRSGFQFLIDYSENNENTKCDIKKRLQTILTHKNTINFSEILYEFKKSLNDSDYLSEFQIDLTHIPLSHDWWKRD